MAAITTTIIKGALEDHLGRIIHPDTEADQVVASDGYTAETKFNQIFAILADTIAKIGGGTVDSGSVNVDQGYITAGKWLCISAGSDGQVVFAQNAYKDHAANTMHYLNTHENMGAKGIVFRHGSQGAWFFDTGMVPTTHGQEFVPALQSVSAPDAKPISNLDLNDLKLNGRYTGEKLTNSPDGGTDWWYVDVIALPGNEASYVYQIAAGVNSPALYMRNLIANTWHPWRKISTNAPQYYASTAAPSASDGADGDVWDVYV